MAEKSKKLEMIDATPPLDIIETYANLSYTLPTAMCEFIDNSIASFTSAPSKKQFAAQYDTAKSKEITVLFEFERNQIVVWDNAYGIENTDLYRAIRLKVKAIESNGLSEFGMGLKTAAFWLGRGFQVITKSAVENRGVKIVVNSKTLTAHKGLIEPTYSDEFQKKWGLSTHGTVVVIENLRRANFTSKEIDECVRSFASRYRKWISNEGMKIRVFKTNEEGKLIDVVRRYNHNVRTKQNVIVSNLREGEFLTYNPPEIKLETTTNLPIESEFSLEFNFENVEYKIPVRLFLRKSGSREEAGIDLFRRGKIIQEKFTGFTALSEQSSFEYQRVNGEMYLENFKVTHTKDKFIWDGGVFEALDSAFKSHPEVKKMVAKARGLRYKTDLSSKESARATKDFKKNHVLAGLSFADDFESLKIAEKIDVIFDPDTDLVFKYTPPWSMDEISFYSRISSNKQMPSWIDIQEKSKLMYVVLINVTDPFVSFFTPPGIPTTTFVNSMRRMSLYWAMAEIDTVKSMRGVPEFRKRLSQLIEEHGQIEQEDEVSNG